MEMRTSRRSPRPVSFEALDTEVKRIDDLAVPVATPAALYRMKRGTVRAKDHQDAAALRERFGLVEEPE